MGGNNPEYDTVCDQGCAMSSLSMALNGKGYNISGQTSNPGALNAWLKQNGGYTCIDGDCNNLVLASPQKLGSPGQIVFLSEAQKPDPVTMSKYVLQQNPIMLAHVNLKVIAD
eukprot:TRINITY_DN4582_c0_g1_i2.p1 TRINITY_DN4582_c0_g1~~TRINITY_DN4582_c0_g1_i2.p1  ORF type:complete len:113 (-),score=18.45 TRINITY_DN4582_c0_g1_i2:233-571(-)